MCVSDDVAPVYSPQYGTGLMKGVAFGKAFSKDGAAAYSGPFLNIGGGGGPAAVNGFVAFDPDPKVRQPSTAVWGLEGGLSKSFPIVSFYVNATYSIPTAFHVSLADSPVLLAGCRLAGGCGR